MKDRLLASIGVLTVMLAAPLPGQAPTAPAKSSPRDKAGSWILPRTPDGHPDLQGIWTNATLTPIERPDTFAGKATVTDAEARAYEKKDLETNDIDREDSPLLARINGGERRGRIQQPFH